MVKCAAFQCRSGYAPTKTDKSLLNVSVQSKRSLSVFTFPKDRDLRARWVSALHRSDTAWNPDNCGVCELHFNENDFRQETRRKNQRQRKKLKGGVVPSVFKSCLRYEKIVSKDPASEKTQVINGSTKVIKKARIGMVLFGLGRAGSIHLGNLLVNPRVDLLYIVEKDEQRYKSLSERWGGQLPPNAPDMATVFADPRVDAVVVATPTFTHFEIIKEALAAGKMVFSEKPIAESADQTQLCYKMAAERGLSIFNGFNRRFDPSFQSIQQAVRKGDIGKVHIIKTVARDSPIPSIEYLKISGGIFHDCAVHDIDLICWIVGKFPRRVLASASAHVPEIAAIGDHDTVAIIMEFEGGAIGTIDLSRNAVYGYDQRLEVFGPGGMLSAGNQRPINVRHMTADGEKAVPYYYSFPSRYHEGYIIELEAFLDHVQGKLALPVLPEESQKVSKVASACEESLKTGAFVTMNYD